MYQFLQFHVGSIVFVVLFVCILIKLLSPILYKYSDGGGGIGSSTTTKTSAMSAHQLPTLFAVSEQTDREENRAPFDYIIMMMIVGLDYHFFGNAG